MRKNAYIEIVGNWRKKRAEKQFFQFLAIIVINGLTKPVEGRILGR